MSNGTRILNCSLPIKARPVYTPIGHDGVMWFMVVSVPLLALFGIIGNTFSFIILKDSCTKVPSHLYLVCLAIFDSLSLFSFLYSFYSNLNVQPILLKFTDEVTFIERYFSSHYACPWRTYTSFTMRLISIWTIVIFSIDRFIVIKFPFNSHRISTIRNTSIAITIVVISSILGNIPWLFGFDRINLCNGRTGCRGNRILIMVRFVEFFFYSIIPSIIILFCNVAIVIMLKKRQHHHTLHTKNDACKQEKEITRRLLLVSTAFVILTFPSLVVISIHSYDRLRKDKSYRRGIKADLFHLSMFLFVVNLSINFILYCLTGPTFRKAAWNLLLCRYAAMKEYRKVIVNDSGAGAPATNLTNDSSGRQGSVSSEKNRLAIILPNISRNPSAASSSNIVIPQSMQSNNKHDLNNNNSTIQPLLVTPI